MPIVDILVAICYICLSLLPILFIMSFFKKGQKVLNFIGKHPCICYPYCICTIIGIIILEFSMM